MGTHLGAGAVLPRPPPPVHSLTSPFGIKCAKGLLGRNIGKEKGETVGLGRGSLETMIRTDIASFASSYKVTGVTHSCGLAGTCHRAPSVWTQGWRGTSPELSWGNLAIEPGIVLRSSSSSSFFNLIFFNC